MEQQCVWGMKLLKTQIKLKDNEELDINDGNLWSLLVCKTNINSEDKCVSFSPLTCRYTSKDTSIPVVTDQLGELDAEKKVGIS